MLIKTFISLMVVVSTFLLIIEAWSQIDPFHGFTIAFATAIIVGGYTYIRFDKGQTNEPTK